MELLLLAFAILGVGRLGKKSGAYGKNKGVRVDTVEK